MTGNGQRFPLGPVTVSRIGFGAMQLPGPGVFGPPRDRGEAIAVLRRAAELGVDHIDTAQWYGPDVANELIRAALYPYPVGLALVSKVGARRDRSGRVLRFDSPADLTRGIEDNLRSLAVDQLPVVNLRLMDDAGSGQRFDDQLAVMVKARDGALIGTVTSYPQYLKAARAARRVAGVKKLHNHLKVVLPSSDSRAEHDAVVNAAWMAIGVCDVFDDLYVTG
jgi:aryl-alcohol dehydrogenase-like predicted oxidoreductase